MQYTLSFILNYRLLLSIIAVFFTLSPSHAQLNDKPDVTENAISNSPSNNIEVIKISTEQTVTSNNFAVIKREDFANTSQTLADLLQSINGLQIRQIGGIGNPVSVSIRGSNSKQVQLFIDDQLVNDSQFGGFDLNQIPTEHIESIEVSKNQAIGTGSTPIGGVIRINTYNPNTDTAKLSLAVGSFDYKEVNAIINKSFNKKHNVSIGGSYLRSDNDYDYLVPQPFFDVNNSTTEPLRNNEFKKKSAFINTNVSLKSHQIRFNIQYNNQDKSLPNYQNNTPENSSSLSSESFSYNYQHIWSSKLNWLDTIELSLNHEDKIENFLDIPANILRLDADYETKKQSAELKSFFVISNQWSEFNITPFITLTKQTFESLSVLNGEVISCNGISSCDVEAKQTQQLIGSRVEWQPNNSQLSGYALFSHLAEDNSNSSLNNVDPAENDIINRRDENHTTQELGLTYQPKLFKAELTYSNGIRTATLFELFGDRGLLRGNDELLPEEAETFTLGTSFSYELFGLPFSVSSAVYHQKNNNSIIAIFNSSGVGSFTNVNDATLNGFEFETSTKINSALSFTLQSNIIDSNTRSEFTAFNNRNLPGIYHKQYSATIQYTINKNWELQLQSNIDQDLYFNRANTTAPEQRNVTSLLLNWQKNNYNINLFIDNIFDDQYQDLANRPAQGINAQLKLSIKGF